MKILLLFLPIFSFSQTVIHQGITASYSHHCRARGVYVSLLMETDNNWFGTMGVGVILPKGEPAFIPLTASAGYYLSDGTVKPFLFGSAFVGLNTKKEYGVYAEAGAGVKIGFLRSSATYRAGAMDGLGKDGEPLDLQGWYISLGVNF